MVGVGGTNDLSLFVAGNRSWFTVEQLTLLMTYPSTIVQMWK